MTEATRTRALCNGDCPVCNSEMGVYAAYAKRTALPIAFDDLNRCDLARWGVSEDAAARLLHVLHEGRLYVGFDAFLALWDQMPRYRWLARIGRVPGLCRLLSWGFARIVARIIHARHKRQKARAAGRGKAG